MQTFVPELTFEASAQCLDRLRLGKQRVEVLQILQALDTGKGWINHPATLMWKDHVHALVEYGVAICDEWISRGYKDTCQGKILAFDTIDTGMPLWWGGPIHLTHQSNLVRKNPEHYRKFWPDVEDNLEYFWPTKVLT